MKHKLATYSEGKKDLIIESLQLMSRFFWGIDPQLSNTIFQGGLHDLLKYLETTIDHDISEDREEINNWIANYPTIDVFQENLGAAFVRLFINDQGGAIAPLYQSCYQENDASIMGTPAIEMKKRLALIGMDLDNKSNEPPDHLAIELEYLLCILDRGWEKQDEQLLEEAFGFIKFQLFPWVNQIYQRISTEPNSELIIPYVSILQKILHHLIK